jgi:hypothetical protein
VPHRFADLLLLERSGDRGLGFLATFRSQESLRARREEKNRRAALARLCSARQQAETVSSAHLAERAA